ncbi:MAG: DUF4249 domain-containing protein [Bacteroidetes bacterium]|jgi:hypothetical protein|nr:DUF4249 domain-containing protein [Bacteroidota bacterium]
MKRISYQSIIVLLLLSVVSSSCTERIELDLANDEPRLVVECMLVNRSEPIRVRLTWTRRFFDNNPPPAVQGATVTVSDGTTIWTLTDTDGDSYYTTPGPVLLENERPYFLTVEVNGQRYEAESYMNSVPELEALTARFIEEGDVPTIDDPGYLVTIFTQEPVGPGDYYYWRGYLDDSLLNSIDDIAVVEDELVDGNKIELELDLYFSRKGRVRIEQLGITRHMFEYFTGLSQLVDQNGNPFSPQPANPVTNVRNVTSPDNYAFGYFSAASISSQEIDL